MSKQVQNNEGFTFTFSRDNHDKWVITVVDRFGINRGIASQVMLSQIDPKVLDTFAQSDANADRLASNEIEKAFDEVIEKANGFSKKQSFDIQLVKKGNELTVVFAPYGLQGGGWGNVVGTVAGVAQAGAGLVIMAGSGGLAAPLGSALISSGISSTVYSVTTPEKELSLGEYATRVGVGLVSGAVTGGVGAALAPAATVGTAAATTAATTTTTTAATTAATTTFSTVAKNAGMSLARSAVTNVAGNVAGTVADVSIRSITSLNPLQGLQYNKIPADGHCLFSAIGLLLNQDVVYLRKKIAAYMEANFKEFKSYRPGTEEDFKKYIESIRNEAEWGGHIEIESIQRITDHPIIIIRPDSNPNIPDNLTKYPNTPIFLYYNGVDHYDAFTVEPENDARTILKAIQTEIVQGRGVTFDPDIDLDKIKTKSLGEKLKDRLAPGEVAIQAVAGAVGSKAGELIKGGVANVGKGVLGGIVKSNAVSNVIGAVDDEVANIFANAAASGIGGGAGGAVGHKVSGYVHSTINNEKEKKSENDDGLLQAIVIGVGFGAVDGAMRGRAQNKIKMEKREQENAEYQKTVKEMQDAVDEMKKADNPVEETKATIKPPEKMINKNQKIISDEQMKEIDKAVEEAKKWGEERERVEQARDMQRMAARQVHEKAAQEARDKAAQEAREKAAQEAREKAAAEAREKAAQEAKKNSAPTPLERIANSGVIRNPQKTPEDMSKMALDIGKNAENNAPAAIKKALGSLGTTPKIGSGISKTAGKAASDAKTATKKAVQDTGKTLQKAKDDLNKAAEPILKPIEDKVNPVLKDASKQMRQATNDLSDATRPLLQPIEDTVNPVLKDVTKAAIKVVALPAEAALHIASDLAGALGDKETQNNLNQNRENFSKGVNEVADTVVKIAEKTVTAKVGAKVVAGMVGGAVGGPLGAAAAVAVVRDAQGETVTGKDVLIDAVAASVGGAVGNAAGSAASGVVGEVGGQIIGAAAAGAAQNGAAYVAKNDGKINAGELRKEVFAGAAGGAAGGAVQGNGVGSEMMRSGASGASDNMVRQYQETGKVDLKQTATAAADSAINKGFTKGVEAGTRATVDYLTTKPSVSKPPMQESPKPVNNKPNFGQWLDNQGEKPENMSRESNPQKEIFGSSTENNGTKKPVLIGKNSKGSRRAEKRNQNAQNKPKNREDEKSANMSKEDGPLKLFQEGSKTEANLNPDTLATNTMGYTAKQLASIPALLCLATRDKFTCALAILIKAGEALLIPGDNQTIGEQQTLRNTFIEMTELTFDKMGGKGAGWQTTDITSQKLKHIYDQVNVVQERNESRRQNK